MRVRARDIWRVHGTGRVLQEYGSVEAWEYPIAWEYGSMGVPGCASITAAPKIAMADIHAWVYDGTGVGDGRGTGQSYRPDCALDILGATRSDSTAALMYCRAVLLVPRRR